MEDEAAVEEKEPLFSEHAFDDTLDFDFDVGLDDLPL